MLQRRGATSFDISPISYVEDAKITVPLLTPLDDEDRLLMETAGWTSRHEVNAGGIEAEYWTLDVGELHERANHLPMRDLVLLEEAEERSDFGPSSPPLAKGPAEDPGDYAPRGEGTDESGWRRVGRYDAARRRALWVRVSLEPDLARNVIADRDVRQIELCSGREGDDAYVTLVPETPGWSALIDVILRAVEAADEADAPEARP